MQPRVHTDRRAAGERRERTTHWTDSNHFISTVGSGPPVGTSLGTRHLGTLGVCGYWEYWLLWLVCVSSTSVVCCASRAVWCVVREGRIGGVRTVCGAPSRPPPPTSIPVSACRAPATHRRVCAGTKRRTSMTCMRACLRRDDWVMCVRGPWGGSCGIRGCAVSPGRCVYVCVYI